MFLLSCLVSILSLATVVLFFANVLLAHVCSKLQPSTAGIADKRLQWRQVSHLLDFSPDRCALECILVRLCASFNYRERLGICELNSVTSEAQTLDDMEEFVYHDIRNWNWIPVTLLLKILTEVILQSQYDCGVPPTEIVEQPPYTFTLTGSAANTSLGTVAGYSCDTPLASQGVWFDNNIPFYNRRYKICNSDSTWTNHKLMCSLSGLDDCVGVKICNPSYPDGHYWIYKEGYYLAKIKVYCHDMATDPKTYITLPPTGNVAHNAGDGVTDSTSTTFSKIRIDAHFNIDRSDFTFATTEGPAGNMMYGEAASCYGNANNKVYGYFRINTTGTGIWIQESNTWAAATTGGSELVNLTYAGGEVSGLCWGQCGTCAPTTTYLKLSDNPSDQVDGSDTVQPICV